MDSKTVGWILEVVGLSMAAVGLVIFFVAIPIFLHRNNKSTKADQTIETDC